MNDGLSTACSFIEYLNIQEGESIFQEAECGYRLIVQDVHRSLEDPSDVVASPIPAFDLNPLAVRALICSSHLYLEPTDQGSDHILRFRYDDITTINAYEQDNGEHEQKEGENENGPPTESASKRVSLRCDASAFTVISRRGRRPFDNWKGILQLEIFPKGEPRLRQALRTAVLKLWNIWTTDDGDRQSAERTAKDFIAEHEKCLEFDTTSVPVNELPLLLCLRGKRIAPMVEISGFVALTSKAIYFRPYFCSMRAAGIMRVPLEDLHRVSRRKHRLKRLGIELYFDRWMFGPDSLMASRSLLLATSSEAECSVLEREIAGFARESVGARLSDRKEMRTRAKDLAKRWKIGQVTNFDYIMGLNDICGRSFNDLSQYPVFPWILQDYASETLNLSDTGTFRDLSKPIAALSPSRVLRGQEMYAALAQAIDRKGSGKIPHDPPWQHGSHYSYPGGVVFYLVRSCPQLMLKLQNGEFDAPNRLFNSMKGAWESVKSFPSDVKELVPEFYMPDIVSGILLNTDHIEFGIRTDGERVHNVELPPWANNPEDFATQMLAAINSPIVSASLHSWVDLVFGKASRGTPALKSNNLFNYMTYDEM